MLITMFIQKQSTDALDAQAAADDYKAAEKGLYDNALYNPIYFRSTKSKILTYYSTLMTSTHTKINHS